jgi:hypothetical protein
MEEDGGVSCKTVAIPGLVRNPITTRQSQSIRTPRSEPLIRFANGETVLWPLPIAVNSSRSIAAFSAAVVGTLSWFRKTCLARVLNMSPELAFSAVRVVMRSLGISLKFKTK